MLVTVARYRAITGDNATPAVTVSAKIELAQELLADALDRELEEAERTETLWPTRDGYLWPSCTPITAHSATIGCAATTASIEPVESR